MNTSSFPKHAFGASAFILSSLLSVTAFAGSGSQLWQTAGKAKSPAAAPAPTTLNVEATHMCAGAAVVPVMAMKPALPNGRGPLVAVQIGTKTVCHLCPVVTEVTSNSLPNGRGRVVRTSVAKTGVEHTCTNCVSSAKL